MMMEDDPEAIVEVDRPTSSTSKTGSARSRPASSGSQKQASRPTTAAASPRPSPPTSRPPTAPLSRVSSGGSTRAWEDPNQEAQVLDQIIDANEEVDDDEEKVVIQLVEPETGCWYNFSRCIGGMWSSKEMEISHDKEIVVRTTIRELIVYGLFLINLFILTFGMTSSVSFYYTQGLTRLFLTEDYNRMYQVREFWNYMKGDFLDALYWDYEFYSEKKYICPGGEDRKGPCPLDPNYRNILYENRLLGLPRIRMLRVRNDSCEVHPDFQNAITECYATYTSSNEDKQPFGSGKHYYTADEAWSYKSQSDLNGARYSGYVATYTGGGAVQTLHSLKDQTLLMFREFEELLWITRATRFISVDFTVYNANLNLFSIAKFALEFPATGGIVADTRFKTVKLIQYVSSGDYVILGCGVIHCAFILYYLIEEGLEIMKKKLPYFFGIWNIMDLVVLTISIVAVYYTVQAMATIDGQLAPLLADPDSFSDFSFLGSSAIANKNIVAILVFFACIKLFKYISFNKTMTQLSSTLSQCAADVGGFGLMFFIVFFAFAQLGYVLFGASAEDYANFSNAIFALLRLILGDFDFDALMAANRTLGPGFFLAYVFFVFFILLNMFLAIINDTYTEVKEEIQFQQNDFEVSDYVKRGVNNARGKMGNRDYLIDIENAIKFAGSDGVISYEELRQNLKKCNFSDMEIEMFFCRYDNNEDHQFDTQEQNKILNDLEFGRVELYYDPHKVADTGEAEGECGTEGQISIEEYNLLDRRVERMEHSMSSIVSKIDAVLLKLESLERAKSKRQDAMDKILGTMSEEDGLDDEAKRKRVEELVRGELETWDKSRPGSTTSQKQF